VSHELRRPSSDAEWAAYHAIRRRVLFEARGRHGAYDAAHPDEHRSGNHPLLLLHDGVPVGTIRIDVSGGDATFRRVAIREEYQHQGHGRAMLELAESFARRKGCRRILSHVDPGAVDFYARCGFVREPLEPTGATVLMSKAVVTVS
jgi:GNAT superfamily N-acetyltransferase